MFSPYLLLFQHFFWQLGKRSIALGTTLAILCTLVASWPQILAAQEERNALPELSDLEFIRTSNDAQEQLEITWHDHDPDDNARITLFYDTDQHDANGWPLLQTPIEEDDPSNRITLPINDMDAGTYFLYAVIDDGINPAQVTYSAASFSLQDKALATPQVLSPTNFSFTSLQNALPATEYISNTIVVSNVPNSTLAQLQGGERSALIKNGIDTRKTTVSVTNGDTLALRTSAPAQAGTTTLVLNLNGQESSWSVTTQAPEVPVDFAGQPPGATAGQFQVNEMGAATYHVPLTVSPGTGGIAPELALSYSHQGGEGILGVGWNLSGLSAISRCQQRLDPDNTNGRIGFDSQDRFCLDGERLVAIAGTYGADGTEYRTEHESFRRIFSLGSAGSGPQKFTVETKSGLTLYYGFSDDSRIEAKDRSDGAVLTWAITRIEDTLGNYLTITYEEEANHTQYRPLHIDYTGNSNAGVLPYNRVEFVYTNEVHPAMHYLDGNILQNTKRLVHIRTKHRDHVVREYFFNYRNSTGTQRALLQSITECGSGHTCFSPTVFTWDSDTSATEFDTQNQVAGLEGQGFSSTGSFVLAGDANGDGKQDIIHFQNNGNHFVALAQDNRSFHMLTAENVGSIAGKTFDASTSRILSCNINSDGFTDFMVFQSNGQHWLALANGDGSFSYFSGAQDLGQIYGQGFSGDNKKFHLLGGDFNGDGKTDTLNLQNDGNHWLSLSGGLSSEYAFLDTVVGLEGTGFLQENSVVFAIDVNADTNSDLLNLQTDGNHWLALSQGDGSFALQNDVSGLENIGYDQKASDIVLGDFNGDSHPDIVQMRNTGDNWIAFSRGDGTFALLQNPAGLAGKKSGGEKSSVHIIDTNLDGRSDLLLINEQGHHGLLLSKGDGTFGWQSSLLGLEGLSFPESPSDIRLLPLDINGDAHTDLVRLKNNGDHWSSTSLGMGSDTLTKIVDGHGVTTMIEYLPLTVSSVYTKAHDAQYPEMDFQSPLYVVSRHSTSNGIGGMASFSYTYGGAKIHLRGRGLQGFAQMRVTDEQTGIFSSTTFSLDHRLAHFPLRSTQQLADGTLLSEATNTLAVADFGQSGRYFPYVESSEKIEYELDGQIVNHTSTQTQYDDRGNVTFSQVTVHDGDPLTKDQFVTTTRNNYTDNVSKWHLGRLTGSEVIKVAMGRTPQTRTSAFTYDATTGLLTSEIIEPDQPQFRLQKSYSYDVFGNIISSTIDPENLPQRTSTSAYDADGRFALQNTNALGHTESTIFEPLLGNIVSQTGPNRRTTTWQYDGFGRQIREIRSDGIESRFFSRLCTETCPQHGVYFLRIQTAGSAPSTTYFDLLGREIRQETLGFDGNTLRRDTHYNSEGQVQQSSEPYFAGDTALLTTFDYDILGRVTTQTAPGNRISSTLYSGLTTTATNAKNQSSVRRVNALGQLLESIDDSGNATFYEYDSYGNLLNIVDTVGNVTSMEYDMRGNKTRMNDPDTGTTTYEYNTLGELIAQHNARNQTVQMEYDLLGRLTSRTEPEGTTNWQYDTAANGIGKLSSIQAPQGYNEDYRYDRFGRIAEKNTTIDEITYTVTSGYDRYSRLEALTYPSGFAVRHQYTNLGYLSSVHNAHTDDLYWQATDINARGQLLTAEFGNGFTTTSEYQPETGYLQRIHTHNTNSSTVVQDLGFTFDTLGNLTNRQDHLQNLSEDFTYDGLNRLITAQVAGQSALTMSYDVLGNIVTRSDVGTYTYGEGNAGPHAVTSVAGARANTYAYDASGNQISSNSRTITYTSFQKPATITENGNTLEFAYGPNYSRYKQTVTTAQEQTTKLYIDDLYERELKNGTSKQTHYIRALGTVVASYTSEYDGTERTAYWHQDHLGSLQAMTDEAGNITEFLSYDAWGQRRNTNWTTATSNIYTSSDRGFTGHEHLAEVSLIHMNGRVYDPTLGRFLSADPVVQAPEFSQSLNRYSYVLNNPLSLTDPSGFFFKKLFKAVKKVFKKAVSFLKNLVIDAISTAVGTVLGVVGSIVGFVIGGPIGAQIGFNFGFGFGKSFTSALLNGASLGDSLRAGLRGGLTKVALFAVDSFFNSYGSQVFGDAAPVAQKLAHGVIEGASTAAAGGKFKHGFLSKSFRELAPSVLGDSFIAKVVIGGTAEELGGGKFVNGAATAAFQYAWDNKQKILEYYAQSKISKDVEGLKINIESLDFDFRDIYNGNIILTTTLTVSYTLPNEKEIIGGIAAAFSQNIFNFKERELFGYYSASINSKDISAGYISYEGGIALTDSPLGIIRIIPTTIFGQDFTNKEGVPIVDLFNSGKEIFNEFK